MPNLRDLKPGDSVVVTSGNGEPALRTVEVVSREWIEASDGAHYSRFTGLRRDGFGAMWHDHQEWQNHVEIESTWRRFRETVAQQETVPRNVHKCDIDRAMNDLRLNIIPPPAE